MWNEGVIDKDISDTEVRLEIIKMLMPTMVGRSIKDIVDNAKELEKYVLQLDEAEETNNA